MPKSASGHQFKPNGLQVGARSRNGPENVEFGGDLGGPLGGQIETKPIKNRSQFLIRFLKALFMDSSSILNAFCPIFVSFFGYVFEHADFLIFEGPLMRFAYFSKVQALKNRSKFDEKTSSNSGHAFCSLFDGFGLHFDLQFGAVWPPRAFKKRVQNQSSKTGRPII